MPPTRGLQVLGALVTSLFLLSAFTPAVNLLAYWRAPGRTLGPADAIVVLGEGGATERIRDGAATCPPLPRSGGGGGPPEGWWRGQIASQWTPSQTSRL